jgi:hypothetical protein
MTKTPTGVLRHSISSPPPPEAYHRAMIVYHAFTLEQQRKPDLDFLTYWFSETRSKGESSGDDKSSYTSEIVGGIEIFRDKVVQESRGRTVSLLVVRGVVFDLERSAVFPETKEYWKSVLESLHHQPSNSVPLSDLSDAVVSFIKSIGENDGSSEGKNSSSEMEDFKRYVNNTLSELRSEIKRESLRVKKEILSSSSANTTAASSPLTVPSLPIESRRVPQESINGQRGRDNRRSWCASCAEDPCVQQ